MLSKGETVNANVNYRSNTGFRFITKSESKKCFQVSVPKPEGGYFHASVGYFRLGERQAMRKAINKRNKAGKRLWGKHWNRVRTDFSLLARLPRSLEPRVWNAKSGTPYYVFNYMSDEFQADKGRFKKKHFKVSIKRMGKLAAYLYMKRKIAEIYKKEYDLLKFMNRNVGTEFK